MNYTISTDPQKLDLSVIHGYLSRSYWSPNIPKETVFRAIRHSLCFGIYLGEAQVGFGRVVTDYATFAYIADVFVLEDHRGKGLSKRLVEAMLEHPELQGLRRWTLGTKDAHGLYARYGFAPSNPERDMVRRMFDKY